jgi:hypothetical protein
MTVLIRMRASTKRAGRRAVASEILLGRCRHGMLNSALFSQHQRDAGWSQRLRSARAASWGRQMLQAGLVILYLVFCVLVGLCGTQRRIGFFGTFLLSLVVTPLVVLIVLMLTAPKRAFEH